MIKKLIIICSVLMLFLSAFSANEVDKNKKELNKLKKQIELNKKKAAESEKKKKAALQNKKQIEIQLQKTRQNVNLLKSTERVLSKNLSLTKEMLNQTSNKLDQSYQFGNKLFVDLLKIHNQDKYLSNTNPDRYPMALMINHTSDIVLSLNLQKSNLENETVKKTDAVKSVQFKGLLENQKAKKYSLQNNQISQEIKKHEKDRLTFINQAKKLEQSAKNLESLIRKLTVKAKPSVQKKYTYKFTGGILNWPAKGRVIKNFGLQTHEKYNIQTKNNGIDIALTSGSAVRASADGQVVYSDAFSGSGKMIIIDHKNGFHTVYSYNSQLLVARGTNVTKGQNIALSGISPSDGTSALHFEIRKNGKPVNPFNYLK